MQNWVDMFCEDPDVDVAQIKPEVKTFLVNPQLTALVIRNEGGLFPQVHSTAAGAEQAIDDYVADFWDEVAEEWRKFSGKKKMPANLEDRRNFYFANHPDSEQAEIKRVEVQYD